MKKIIILFVASALILVQNSCSKDDEKTQSTVNTFKCKINGVDKTFETNTFLTDGEVNVVAFIGGKENSTETIWLTVPEKSTTKWDLFYTSLVTQFYPTSNFVVTITNNDSTAKTIKGTFSGSVKQTGSTNSKTLTEGVFDIKY